MDLLDKDGDVVVPRRPRERRAAASGRAATEESQRGETGARDSEELVLSEVHLDCRRAPPSLGSRTAAGATTAFHDADGREVVSIQHALATPLRSVGLQVWRGALLLADYILSQVDAPPGAAGAAGAAGSAGQAAQQQHVQRAGGDGAAQASPLHGITALELGAGSGLAGLVLANVARRVFLTDVGVAVLSNCRRNAERHLSRHPPQPLPQHAHPSRGAGTSSSLPDNGGAVSARVAVRQLDWLDPPDWLLPPGASGAEAPAAATLPAGQQQQEQAGGLHGSAVPACTGPAAAAAVASDGMFAWRAGDLPDLQRLDLLLAADPVYEDTLTEGLMRCALLLMQYAERHSGRSPRLLVALERRIVFTLRDAAERAPAFEYWQMLFEGDHTEQWQDQQQQQQQQQQHQQQEQQQQQGSCEGRRDAPSSAAGPAAGGEPAARAGGSAAVPAAPRAAAFPLVGRRLEVEGIPQRLFPYERSQYLELWELRLRGAR